MTRTTPESTTRELDRRTNDGIEVRLMWNSYTNQVMVAVHDSHTEESFELQVAGADALDAFHHPYAYMSMPTDPVRVRRVSTAEGGTA